MSGMRAPLAATERVTLTLGETLAELGERLLQCLYPPVCAGCETALYGSREPLCPACVAKIQWVGEGACELCGAPAGPYARRGAPCDECRGHDLRFTRAVAVARFESPVRELIHALKYGGARRFARAMGRRLAERVLATRLLVGGGVEAVIPVPLHKKRRRERGFNQAELLARPLAERLQLPLRTDILMRTHYTVPQARLGREERHALPTTAFHVAPAGTPRRVLLVDDVMTTGRTLSACSEVLRAAGAERIYVAVYAR